MSKSVDERVVEMQFDNKQFESGIKTSLKSLDNLKKGLNFESATKSLSKMESASQKFSLSGIEKGIDIISSRFTNLGIVGVTALQNITNAAINAGTRMVKALTIDPVLTGFNEYETKMNAITTILTNTASKGSTLDDVNKALNELNTYADKTIYNFAEMTRNIGTFTAAGVDLETATKAIQGIANLAAGSGSTSAQASTAMYQLSQAIAAGRVSLQDWNSVVNAGMGGELFQNALKETAKQMGIVVDESVSFRESISAAGGGTSWLTSDVLVKTLEKFADDESLLKAATQVKTFTQLIDTMKESVQSVWAQSWEYIIGDREQAAELFTAMSDGFNSIIGPSTEARNAALKFWNANGGREATIKGISNVLETLGDVLSPIGEAFDEAFPDVTGERLVDISKKFSDLTENFKIGDKTAQNIKSTFSGLLSVVQLFGKGVSAVIKPVFGLTDGVGSIAGSLLSATGAFGDFLTELNKSSSVDDALNTISSGLSSMTESVSDFISSIFSGTGEASEVLKDFADVAVNILETAVTKFSEIIKWISDNVSIGDVFAGLAGGGIFVVAKKLSGVFDTIKDALDNFLGNGEKINSLKKNFSDILSSVHDSINSFSTGIKVGSLVSISIAIGILSASLNTIADLKTTDIAKSLTAISIMMVELSIAFRSVTKSLNKFDSKGIVKAGISLIAISTAIRILASAMTEIGQLDLAGVAKGLAGIGGMLAELSIFLKATDLKGASIKGALSLIAIAEAINIMSEAIGAFSNLSWGELGRGLTGFGGSLLGLITAVKVIGNTKISLSTSVAIIALAESCRILSDAVSSFSTMSWDEIGRGLTSMGIALAELTASVSILGKIGGGKSLLGSASIFIVTQSLDEISRNLKKLGDMSWEEIGKGLTAMGGALAELGVVSGVLGKTAGFSGILGSASILIAVQSLDPIATALSQIGSLSWGEIGRGLTGMGVALLELGVIAGLLGTLAPLSILGGGAILLGVQGLGTLAEAMQSFGSMTWGEIGKALVAMGLALTELGIIAGLLGTLAPLSILGSGAILLGVQGLGTLADALKKFGEMDWDTIGRGLAAMGAAMGETAIGGLLNTFSGFGAGAIAEMAPALGTLADSLSKWNNVTVPEGLGVQLGILADGVMKFTFGGLGAGALSTAAPGLGQMADAIKKWQDVTVPDGLEDGLTEISNGVKSFTWAFVGGWSIGEVTEPLGNLATTIKKWNDVKIPDGIGDGLTELADGIGSFTWSFAAGWSLGEVVEPLGDLGSALQNWSSVTISDGIGDGLTRLATGIQSFLGYDYTTLNLSDIGSGLSSIAVGVSMISGVNLTSVSSGLTSFATSIQNIPTLISSASQSISSSITGLTFAILIQSSGIYAAFSQIMEYGISAVLTKSSSLQAAGTSIMTAFLASLRLSLASGGSILTATIVAVFNMMITSSRKIISSSQKTFQNDGKMIIVNFINGIQSQRTQAVNSIRTIVSDVKNAADDYNNSFYYTGQDMIQGLINGIRSKKSEAINAAARVASESLEAAKKALDSNSPSKKFVQLGKDSDTGLAIGFLGLINKVDKASTKVAETALNSVGIVLERLPNILSNDVNFSPRITPVLDLSNTRREAETLNTLLSVNPMKTGGILVDSKSVVLAGRFRSGGNSETAEPVSANVSESGNTFNQYIYSPKAVSRTDIYRQTKNLFSLEKGVVKR
nr:MAG TPA_asm: tail tape measure [Caudoviricetes sp.]